MTTACGRPERVHAVVVVGAVGQPTPTGAAPLTLVRYISRRTPE
jgi:hypothetical protein